jgi:thiosulfate/3-mercaptopyruvate sulfurtransferase
MVSPDTNSVDGAVSWVTPSRLADHDADEPLLLDCQPIIPEDIDGHVPHAHNLPWTELTIEGNSRQLRPLAEISAAAADVGATPERVFVCSCGTGREATNEFLIFHYLLGCPKVRLSGGSFSVWLSRPGNPTVTGPNPG